MKNKKVVALLAVAGLYASLLVGGTLAYFTDQDVAVNKFTVGDVDIELEEPSWDIDKDHVLLPGVMHPKDPTITIESTSQPSYVFLEVKLDKHKEFVNLMGINYAEVINKDDILENDVVFNSETYLDEFVTGLQNGDEVVQKTVNQWFDGIEYSKWMVVDTSNIDEGTLVLGYIGDGTPKGLLCNANDEVVFMKSFGMPSTVTQEMLEDKIYNANIQDGEKIFNLSFKALAIQAEGLNCEDTDISKIMLNAYTHLR